MTSNANPQHVQEPYVPQDDENEIPYQQRPGYGSQWGAHSALPPSSALAQSKPLVRRPLFWILVAMVAIVVAGILACMLLTRVPDVSGMTIAEAQAAITSTSDKWQTNLEPADSDITVPVEVLERMFYADGEAGDALTIDHTDPAAGRLLPRYNANQQVTLYVDRLKDLEEMRESALESAMQQSVSDSVASMDFEQDGMILVLNAHTSDASYDMIGTDFSDFDSTFGPFCEEAAEATGSDVILRLYSSDGFLVGISVGPNSQADDAERQGLADHARDMATDADSYAHDHADEYLQAFFDQWTKTNGSDGGTYEWTASDSIIVRMLSSYGETSWSGSADEVTATRERHQAEADWMARMLRVNVTIEYVNSGGDAWDTFVADCPAWPDFSPETSSGASAAADGAR